MRLAELAERIGARVLGDASLEVRRVRAVDEAGHGDVAFVESARERRAAFGTAASAVLVSEDFAADHAHELPCASVVVASLGRALADVVGLLHPLPERGLGIHPRAEVDGRARIGADVQIGALAVVGNAWIGAGVTIGALAVIGDDVEIGARSTVGPGAVLMPGTRLGEDVLVGPGAVLGDEGFVHAPVGEGSDELVAVRHTAGVVVGRSAAIGANACVDRGLLRDTRVGARAVLDNLVQVGHDVAIGEGAVLVAQVGVGGDARIGDGAVLAGQVGVGDRKVVGRRARVGGQSGVTHDVADGAAVSGTPAIPHAVWLRAMVRLQKLDTLEKRVRLLEQHLAERVRADSGDTTPNA